MKTKQIKSTLVFALAILFISCSQEKVSNTQAPAELKALNAGFSKGVDISWAKQMYANGRIWKDNAGVTRPLWDILKQEGVNTVSLRIWVNPSSDPANGHCSVAETTDEAALYYKQGFRICVCPHYGDTWNSVGHQAPPAAWKNFTYSQMKTAIANHVKDIMTQLKNKGVTPEWFKNGNEINGGICPPIGSRSNGAQMTGLLNAGYDAAKAIFPNIKVIIHVGQPQNAPADALFSTFTANGGKWDILGVSSYGHGSNIPGVFGAIKTLQAKYKKPVIQVEYGGSWDKVSTATDLKTWITNINSMGSNGQGVWYWEPDCYNWNGYNLGAYDPNTFKPSSGILDVFKAN